MREIIRPTVRLRAAARLLMAALIVLVTVIGVGAAPRLSYAQSLPISPCVQSTLDSGEIRLICMPPPPIEWNQQLVVYAHGYADPDADLTLPFELNLFVTDPSTGAPVLNPESIPALLLANGYAFATTSYSKNGYVVEQGGEDIDALVKAVKLQVKLQAQQQLELSVAHDGHKKHHEPTLKRIYLVGLSQGGLISTMLVERDPKTYNGGALAMCAPLAGWSYEVQYFGDFARVFAYFLPEVAFNLSTAATDLDRITILAAAFEDRDNDLAFQQLFSVTGAAVDPSDSDSAFKTTMDVLYYSTPAVLEDLAETARGNPYDNWRTRYRGSLDDKALNDRITGVERIRGDRKAMRYVDRFYTPDGDLRVPVVTLHNMYDPVVPYAQEAIYAKLVRKEHSSRWLTSLVSTNPYGHCIFTQDETIGALSRLLNRQLVPPTQPPQPQ